MEPITLAITNYNRNEMLLDSYRQVIDDPRIDEVVIMDDCSEPSIYRAILQQSHPKLQITRQAQNRGMSRNKADAIALSKNPWCIIFDSDNIIDHRYLDAIPEELFPDTFYLPAFAEPQFDYRQYAGLQFDRTNIQNFIDDPMFQCLLNSCNMLVNSDAYMGVYKEDPQHKASDTIYMNYLWLSNGGTNIFSDDNRLLTPKLFLDKVMADEKILKVSDGQQNSGQQQNNFNGQQRQQSHNNGSYQNGQQQNQNGAPKGSAVLRELTQSACG